MYMLPFNLFGIPAGSFITATPDQSRNILEPPGVSGCSMAFYIPLHTTDCLRLPSFQTRPHVSCHNIPGAPCTFANAACLIQLRKPQPRVQSSSSAQTNLRLGCYSGLYPGSNSTLLRHLQPVTRYGLYLLPIDRFDCRRYTARVPWVRSRLPHLG